MTYANAGGGPGSKDRGPAVAFEKRTQSEEAAAGDPAAAAGQADGLCGDGWCSGRSLALAISGKHDVPASAGQTGAPARCAHGRSVWFLYVVRDPRDTWISQVATGARRRAARGARGVLRWCC